MCIVAHTMVAVELQLRDVHEIKLGKSQNPHVIDEILKRVILVGFSQHQNHPLAFFF